MQKRYLLAPGPTQIPPVVLLKMAEPILHHRNPMFEEIVSEVREGLKWLFGTKNEVLFFASSGTGAMEGAVTNMLSPNDKAIVVRSGKFGDRWANICKAYGVQAVEISVPWGDEIDPALVEKALKENPDAKAVYTHATETSTGVRYPVKEVAAIVKNYPNTICVIDGITGVGVFELPMDASMWPPGRAFAGVSDKPWEMNKTSKMPRFYFNWTKELTNLQKNQTNFTPAISLIVGLRESLKMMREDGLEKVYKRAEILARATREGAIALGLKPFAKNPSPAVTAIYAPEGIDGQAIYKSLWKKYGVTGAGGQDHLKGKIFRIATLGYADKYDVVTAIAALEFTLKDLGHKFKMGAGVGRALEILQEL